MTSLKSLKGNIIDETTWAINLLISKYEGFLIWNLKLRISAIGAFWKRKSMFEYLIEFEIERIELIFGTDKDSSLVVGYIGKQNLCFSGYLFDSSSSKSELRPEPVPPPIELNIKNPCGLPQLSKKWSILSKVILISSFPSGEYLLEYNFEDSSNPKIKFSLRNKSL